MVAMGAYCPFYSAYCMGIAECVSRTLPSAWCALYRVRVTHLTECVMRTLPSA